MKKIISMVSAPLIALLVFSGLLWLAPLSLLTLLGLSIPAIALSLYQLFPGLQESDSSHCQRKEDVRARMESLTAANRDLEAGFSLLLSSCSDLLCIYSDGLIQTSSAEFQRLSHSLPNFWDNYLPEEHQIAFTTCICQALKGENETIRVKLKQIPPSILPLSPILDSGRDWKDVNWKLCMQPIRYQGKPAVLIAMRPERDSEPVSDFVKTFNHEFRTPLNVIIGLSDLITCDEQGRSDLFTHRQWLIRQCAYTLLATVNSIIQQCELKWKVPTGLNHAAFHTRIELQAVISSVQNKLKARENSLNLALNPAVPVSLWGNATQFRHMIGFLVLTVSNITKNDSICIRINAKNHKNRSDLYGDIEASCPAVCTRADFNSILQVFTAPAEEETLNYTYTLRAAEQQAMLDLSIAREMCKLLFGDLEVMENRQLHLRFSMSFSTRAQYVLKRKGNICSDVEEFVRVEAPAYFNHKDEVFDHSEMPYADKTLFRSESSVTCRPCKVQSSSRRAYTISSHHTDLTRLPSSSGDKDDSPPLDSVPIEPFALIADDVPMNATVLCQMLARLGVRTAVVSNGVEAFHFMQTSQPDVVFMDCEMPVMDGLEATRRLRETGVKVPIVAVTANGPEKEAECLEAGMDYFVCKPVRFAALAGLLEKLKLK